jgi:hypothetical protein
VPRIGPDCEPNLGDLAVAGPHGRRFRGLPLRLGLTDIVSGDEGFLAFAPENNHPNVVATNFATISGMRFHTSMLTAFPRSRLSKAIHPIRSSVEAFSLPIDGDVILASEQVYGFMGTWPISTKTSLAALNASSPAGIPL